MKERERENDDKPNSNPKIIIETFVYVHVKLNNVCVCYEIYMQSDPR